MHWIQTIRAHLELSKEELAHYLGLSVHTIKSVENDRRLLPFYSLQAAITLFNTIKDCSAQDHAGEPLLKADDHIQHLVSMHRRCCRRRDRCHRKLEKMQKAYPVACLRLKAYELLAETLSLARNKDDLARLQWVRRKIKETMQQVIDNSITAQHLLAAEIAGLESMVLALEHRFFA